MPKIFPIIGPIATIISLEVLFRYPNYIIHVGVINALIIFYCVWHISMHSLKREFWNLLILPMLYTIAVWLFSSIAEGKIFREIIMALLTILLAIYLFNIYIFWHKREKYQSYSLLNISNYLQLIAIFLFAAGLYWLKLFLGMPMLLMLCTFAFVVLLLSYQTFTIEGFYAKRGWLYILVLSFISIEFFWFVSFTPFSVYINASIIMLMYYIMLGLARNFILRSMNTKVVLRYLSITIVSLAMILITAKYI